VGSHDTGVDFANRALFLRGILLLDDARHPTGGVTHDTTITRRIGQLHGQNGQRVTCRMRQFLQRLGPDQGHIAIQHQGRSGFRQERYGEHDGMAGSELRILQHPGQIGDIDGGANHLAAVPINDAQLLRSKAARRVDHVREERLTGERMQNLRQIGVHALALPGG